MGASERTWRIRAPSVPEQPATSACAIRSVNLLLHLRKAIGDAAEREVLEPWADLNRAAIRPATPVGERCGHRWPRRIPGLADAKLAIREVRRIDHGVDGVEGVAQLSGLLTNAKIAGRGEPKHGGGDVHTEWLERHRSLLQKRGDGVVAITAGIVKDHVCSVAVSGIAHVVEHDLVKAEFGGIRCQLDRVFP